MNEEAIFTQEMAQTLARAKERWDAEDAEKKRQEQRRVAFEALKADPSYSVLQKGGIEEMLNKNPEYLDNQTTLKLAIDNTLANLKVREAEEKVKQQVKAEPQMSNGYNPSMQSSNSEQVEDTSDLSAQDFLKKVLDGKATENDLSRTKNIDPFTKYYLRKAFKGGSGNAKDIMAKNSEVFGLEE